MLYEYNTTRENVKLPEYGRNIQKLIDYAITIKDRDERNKFANKIISIMSSSNAGYKDPQHYKRKLWDHLALMSDFKLDVDWPFEKPTLEVLKEKPRLVPYNQQQIKYKHYGKTVELLIQKAVELEEGEEKTKLIYLIANHMKRLFITWNREENISDSTIFANMEEISGGKLKVDASKYRLSDVREMINKKKRSQKKNK